VLPCDESTKGICLRCCEYFLFFYSVLFLLFDTRDVINIEKDGHEILNDSTCDETTKGMCFPCSEYTFFYFFSLFYTFCFIHATL
jgi:hypothetical protein